MIDNMNLIIFSRNFISKLTRMMWLGYIADMEKMRNSFNFFEKPESNRPFERSRNRCDDNIKRITKK
jgi:hypothetical protein